MGVNFIIIRDVKNWADREVRLYWKIKQGIEAIRQIIWAKTAHNHFSSIATWRLPREVFHFGWLTHHLFTLSVSTLRKTQKLQFIPYLFKVFMLPFDACFSLFTVNESPEKKTSLLLQTFIAVFVALCWQERGCYWQNLPQLAVCFLGRPKGEHK